MEAAVLQPAVPTLLVASHVLVYLDTVVMDLRVKVSQSDIQMPWHHNRSLCILQGVCPKLHLSMLYVSNVDILQPDRWQNFGFKIPAKSVLDPACLLVICEFLYRASYGCLTFIYLVQHSITCCGNIIYVQYHALDVPHFSWTELFYLDLWWFRYRWTCEGKSDWNSYALTS